MILRRTLPLFAQALGPDWDALPKQIRQTHETRKHSHWQGRAQIRRGRSIWPSLLARLFRFPAASDDTPIHVRKTITAQGEYWDRRFGHRHMGSHLAFGPRGMTERFGPFTFDLGLYVAQDALHYPVIGARLGPVPLPRWLLPISESREYVQDGVFHFDVALYAPISKGLMVHYRGWLCAAQNPA